MADHLARMGDAVLAAATVSAAIQNASTMANASAATYQVNQQTRAALYSALTTHLAVITPLLAANTEAMSHIEAMELIIEQLEEIP